MSPTPRPALIIACSALVVAATVSVGWGALPGLASGRADPSVPTASTSALASASAPAYVCPPGGAPPLVGGVCMRALASPIDYLVEPDLAVSPSDPGTMAVVSNAGQSVHAVDPLLSGSMQVRNQKLAVFVTDDAGATWTRVEMPDAPQPPAPLEGVVVTDIELWDPTIAFDADGTLHVVGVVVWEGVDGSAKQRHVFHISTSDLGATWTDYTILGAKVDRPWMTIESGGAIDIVWWETRDTTLGFARSVDDGATWTGLSAGATPIPCYFPSPPIEHEGAIVVACALDYRFVTDPSLQTTRVYRYDASANAFTLKGSLGRTSISSLFSAPDGSLAIVAGEYAVPDVILARSIDGGATWTELPKLAARLDHAGAWTLLQFMGGRMDPWGHVEIFVRGIDLPHRPDLGAANPYVDLPEFLGAAYADEFAVAHVVLDPASGDVLSEGVLTPLVSHAPASASGSAGVGRAGDAYGIGFAGDRAVLVWEYQRALYVTHYAP